MTFVGGLFGILLICLYFGVIIFLITLLWRLTTALERVSRHLLEIAKDVKRLSYHSDGEDEQS